MDEPMKTKWGDHALYDAIVIRRT